MPKIYYKIKLGIKYNDNRKRKIKTRSKYSARHILSSLKKEGIKVTTKIENRCLIIESK